MSGEVRRSDPAPGRSATVGWLGGRSWRPAAAPAAGGWSDRALTVEAPITPPANDMQVQLGDYPIERLVLTSLLEGLGELQHAIEIGQTSELLAQPPRRINANICEAILGMKPPAPDVTWELSISWSPLWPMDDASLPRLQPLEFAHDCLA